MTARLAVIAAFWRSLMVSAQAPSRVFVVVFDDQHLSSGGLKRLQAAAVTLFTNEFQPGDLGGVVVDGQLVGDRLLSERAELLKAVERAHPRLATASDLEASAAVPGGVEPSARLAEIETLDVARAALDRKLSIVETLVGQPGADRRSKGGAPGVGGFGGDAAVAARARRMAEAAKRAGVRFHVFDESGNDRDAAGGLARAHGRLIVAPIERLRGGDCAHRSGDEDDGRAVRRRRPASAERRPVAASPAKDRRRRRRDTPARRALFRDRSPSGSWSPRRLQIPACCASGR